MISIRVDVIWHHNDTYNWLHNTVDWSVENCPSFQCTDSRSVEQYIIRQEDFHYRFEFADDEDASLFALRWS